MQVVILELVELPGQVGPPELVGLLGQVELLQVRLLERVELFVPAVKAVVRLLGKFSLRHPMPSLLSYSEQLDCFIVPASHFEQLVVVVTPTAQLHWQLESLL